MYKLLTGLLLFCFWQLPLLAQQAPVTPANPPDSAHALSPKTPAKKKQYLRLVSSPENQKMLRKYNYRKEHTDSLAAVKELRKLVLQLREDAWLTASADSLYSHADTLVAKLHLGEQFSWVALKPGNVSEALILRAGFRERFFRQKPFRPRDFTNLQERLLDYAETSGYPFAAVQLDSVELLPENGIAAVLVLDSGPFITFDSVQILGETKTKSKFLARYLQIGVGQPYNQQRVEASARLLRQLPYLRQVRASEVRFAGNKARVYYFLEDKRANQLDGILGLVPNPQTEKLMLTGELTAALRNISGTGKQIALQWRKPGVESQLLEVGYTHPNLFGSPIEFEFNFNLYKQDTTFLNLEPRFQFSYYTTRFGKVGFFTQLRSSRLLYAIDTAQASVVPAYASSNTQSYGINHTWNNLDDIFIPRKGWRTSLTAAVGTKKVRSLTAEQAEQIPAESAQITVSANLERFTRVSRASTLLLRTRWSGLFNDRIFMTDMFRLGGLSTLRGFNELEFYASRFAVATAELRYFTGPDSYLLAFFDQGYFQNNLQNRFQDDYPFGLGAGISFSTGAGIFSFVYSVGKSDALQQELNLQDARIHFGITNRF